MKCSEDLCKDVRVKWYDVRILKWYVGINDIPYFIYAEIYPRARSKIVLLFQIKYVDQIFRLNGSRRFLCTKCPILYLLNK